LLLTRPAVSVAPPAAFSPQVSAASASAVLALPQPEAEPRAAQDAQQAASAAAQPVHYDSVAEPEPDEPLPAWVAPLAADSLEQQPQDD
jgi:hypothetical protein